MSSVAKDGKNGHGLKLEKAGLLFSSFIMLCLQKLLKKYYDWCYLVKFDLCFLFNPMGAFLNYYVDFWLCSPHAQMVMELYWCRLPANHGAANQNKIVFILPTHWFSHKVNYLKYKLPANNRVGLGSGKMWHGDINSLHFFCNTKILLWIITKQLVIYYRDNFRIGVIFFYQPLPQDSLFLSWERTLLVAAWSISLTYDNELLVGVGWKCRCTI